MCYRFEAGYENYFLSIYPIAILFNLYFEIITNISNGVFATKNANYLTLLIEPKTLSIINPKTKNFVDD